MIDKIKQIIKKPSLVYLYLSYLGYFKNVPDEIHLKRLFKIMIGKPLNLNSPQTFNEKMQWLKINNRKNEYTNMVDKYEMKKIVSNLIGDSYVIPTIGIYEKFEDIKFDELPDQFVIKCTHDSGGIVICNDKNNFNIKKAKNKIDKCLKKNYYWMHREWPYKNVKPRIIIEKYMATEKQPELIDYKFFCFNGEPKFLYISEGLSNHSTAKISFVDMNYNKSQFYRNDYKPFDKLPKKPVGFEKMKELAKKLSKEIPFVRVDFYEIEDRIYFGELTFYPCSGFIPFEPEKYDKILGDMLKLPKIEEKDEK